MKFLKYYFFIGSCVLIFMGSLLKLDGKENYYISYIGGIVNFAAFLYLQLRKPSDKRAKEISNKVLN